MSPRILGLSDHHSSSFVAFFELSVLAPPSPLPLVRDTNINHKIKELGYMSKQATGTEDKLDRNFVSHTNRRNENLIPCWVCLVSVT